MQWKSTQSKEKVHYAVCHYVFVFVYQQDLQHQLPSMSLWWWVIVWLDCLCPGNLSRMFMDPFSTMWWVTRTSHVIPLPTPAPCLQWTVGRYTLSRSRLQTRPGPVTHPAPRCSSPVSRRTVLSANVVLFFPGIDLTLHRCTVSGSKQAGATWRYSIYCDMMEIYLSLKIFLCLYWGRYYFDIFQDFLSNGIS